MPLYGLRGVRIGEASHPGPSARRRRRVRSSSAQDHPSGPDPTLLDDLERDLVSVDASEDEPLVRPNTGRHVVARMEVSVHDELPCRDTVRDDQSADTADIETLTVAASPRALVAAGVGDAVQPCSATSLLSMDTVHASRSVLALAGRDIFPQATEEDVAHNRSHIVQPAPPSALIHDGEPRIR